MSNIVSIKNSQLVTTSVNIADGIVSQHSFVLHLINQNITELKKLGEINYENNNVALLNQSQTNLLISRLQPTPVIKLFKIRLTQAFLDIRKPKEIVKTAVESNAQNSHGCVTIQEFAKSVGIGPNRLFAQLRQDGYMQNSKKKRNTPYQIFIHQELFKLVKGTFLNPKTSKVEPYFRTLLTTKGQLYFTNKYFTEQKASA